MRIGHYNSIRDRNCVDISGNISTCVHTSDIFDYDYVRIYDNFLPQNYFKDFAFFNGGLDSENID